MNQIKKSRKVLEQMIQDMMISGVSTIMNSEITRASSYLIGSQVELYYLVPRSNI